MKTNLIIYCTFLLFTCWTGSIKANSGDSDISFQLFMEHTNVSCPGQSNGTAEVVIDGNSGPYLIEWSTGATTAKIENLKAGTYIVEVSDSEGKI